MRGQIQYESFSTLFDLPDITILPEDQEITSDSHKRTQISRERIEMMIEEDVEKWKQQNF